MIKVIKNFDKDDCVHFERVKARGCCGRWTTAGVCTIPVNGNPTHRMCSLKMKWCQYQKKEEENVHS